MAPSVRAVATLAAVLGMSAAGLVRAYASQGGKVSAPFGASAQRDLPATTATYSSATAPLVNQPAAAVPVLGDSTPPRPPRRIVSGRLRLSLAAAHVTVLDPLASPLRYGGGGLAAAAALAHVSGHSAIELSVEAALPQLRSTLSAEPGGPRESTVFTAARALWLRRVGGGERTTLSEEDRTGLLLGAEGRFEGSLRDHRYREPALHFFYGLALASIGPAARWQMSTGRHGELSVEAAAPLLGMAYRPYCDLAFIRSGVRPRLAAPPSLAALDAGVAWALPLGRSGARAVAEWRLAYLRYRDHDLYRSARQRLGLGLDLPTGYRR